MAAYLIVSADAGSVTITCADPVVQRGHRDAAARSSAPTTTRSGCRKSSTAVPSRRNSGFDTTAHVGPLQHPLDDLGRSDRHRRLVDDDRPGPQDGADLGGRGLDVAQVGAAVVTLRRGHAQEHDLGVAYGVRRTDDEPQPPVVDALGDQLVQAMLDDGDLAGRQPLDLVRVDVAADDVVAEVGEACPGGQPDVAGADDGEARRLVRRRGVRAVAHRQRRVPVALQRRSLPWRRCSPVPPTWPPPSWPARSSLPGRARPDTTLPADLVEACGEQPGIICENVLDSTDSEALAKAADWVIGRPLKIVMILVVAWVVLARRPRRCAPARPQGRRRRSGEHAAQGRGVPRRCRGGLRPSPRGVGVIVAVVTALPSPGWCGRSP